MAHATAHVIEASRTTLVRCRSGYNRSGLVAAQVIVHLGHEATAAIQLIQQKRSPWALNNQTFQEYLTTGLDVAYLLTELQG